MSKETFKLFVRKHPTLAQYVASGEASWQKFYEMFDMYGENSVVWDPYKIEKITRVTTNAALKPDTTVKDLVQMIKGIDLETVRKGIDGVQKAIGLVQDLSTPSAPPKAYEPRPMYKYFED